LQPHKRTLTPQIHPNPHLQSNFLSSKFKINIGGSNLTAQEAGIGDSKGDASKVQNSVGLNFDFTIRNAGFNDKDIENYYVDLASNSKNSIAIRNGEAKLTFKDSATSGINLAGEESIGYLSDGATNNSLTYNNTTNKFEVSGKNSILFATKSGGTLKVSNSLPLSTTSITGEGFTLAYSENSGSTVTLSGGVTGTVEKKNPILYYAKDSGKIVVT